MHKVFKGAISHAICSGISIFFNLPQMVANMLGIVLDNDQYLGISLILGGIVAWGGVYIYQHFFCIENFVATNDQKLQLKQDVNALLELLLSYKSWNMIQDETCEKYNRFQSSISFANNKKTKQVFRDVENAFGVMIDHKRQNVPVGNDDVKKARDRLEKTCFRFLKLI